MDWLEEFIIRLESTMVGPLISTNSNSPSYFQVQAFKQIDRIRLELWMRRGKSGESSYGQLISISEAEKIYELLGKSIECLRGESK